MKNLNAERSEVPACPDASGACRDHQKVPRKKTTDTNVCPTNYYLLLYLSLRSSRLLFVLSGYLFSFLCVTSSFFEFLRVIF